MAQSQWMLAYDIHPSNPVGPVQDPSPDTIYMRYVQSLLLPPEDGSTNMVVHESPEHLKARNMKLISDLTGWSQHVIAPHLNSKNFESRVIYTVAQRPVKLHDSINKTFKKIKLRALCLQMFGSENPVTCDDCAAGELGPFRDGICTRMIENGRSLFKGRCGTCVWSGNNRECTNGPPKL